jgi:hypothetical protein
VTPHVTQNVARPGGSAIDGRTTRHAGYAMSQHAATDRAGVRLVEDDRLDAQGQAAWIGQRELVVRVCVRRSI